MAPGDSEKKKTGFKATRNLQCKAYLPFCSAWKDCWKSSGKRRFDFERRSRSDLVVLRECKLLWRRIESMSKWSWPLQDDEDSHHSEEASSRVGSGNSSTHSQLSEHRKPFPETRFNVEDTPKFRDVIGDASTIPQDGRIDLLFRKAYLESCEGADAEKAFEEIQAYVQTLVHLPPRKRARFSIMDFWFPFFRPKTWTAIHMWVFYITDLINPYESWNQ
jgi:hypothetical protein